LDSRQRIAFDDRHRERFLHTELTPVLDTAGAVVAVAIISFDITDRCLMEERLRRSVTELEKSARRRENAQRPSADLRQCKKIASDKGYWSSVEQYLGAQPVPNSRMGALPRLHAQLYPNSPKRIAAPPRGDGRYRSRGRRPRSSAEETD
jgi:hypothetical protein